MLSMEAPLTRPSGIDQPPSHEWRSPKPMPTKKQAFTQMSARKSNRWPAGLIMLPSRASSPSARSRKADSSHS